MQPVLDYRSHGRDLGANRYVYAVVSRRARGLSIGVNMNPDRVCNFDCPYCQVDRSGEAPSGTIDTALLGSELDALLHRASSGELWREAPFDTVAAPLRRVADVAFAGDGEPTTPREFAAAARVAREALNRASLHVPLRLLTNATLFDRPRVREALASLRRAVVQARRRYRGALSACVGCEDITEQGAREPTRRGPGAAHRDPEPLLLVWRNTTVRAGDRSLGHRSRFHRGLGWAHRPRSGLHCGEAAERPARRAPGRRAIGSHRGKREAKRDEGGGTR